MNEGKSNRRTFLVAAPVVLATLLHAPAVFAQGAAPKFESESHPLDPALKYAYEGLENIDSNIKDYTCTMVKRERVRGELTEHQYIYMKVRHKPFSVYMHFLKPDRLKGQEAIYVAGRDDGKMWGHAGRGPRKLIGWVALKPESPIAMQGNRYPITMAGIRVLVQRLAEVGEHDRKFDEIDVQFLNGAKINGRVCTCIQSVHPVPRDEFRYHMARIFIDDELQIPIRFEAYLWPRSAASKPILVEEYTYLNVKLNTGLTDEDFDHRSEKLRLTNRRR